MHKTDHFIQILVKINQQKHYLIFCSKIFNFQSPFTICPLYPKTRQRHLLSHRHMYRFTNTNKHKLKKKKKKVDFGENTSTLKQMDKTLDL